MATNNKCACKDYFINFSQIAYSLNLLQIFPEASYNFTANRPFIPLAIQKKVTDNYQIDFTASSTFYTLFNALAQDCKTASYNFIKDSIADPQYTAGNYGAYLAQRISIDSELIKQNRYKQAANIVIDFWANYDATILVPNYLQLINQLIEQVKQQVDKRYFIAPGSYHVADPNDTNTICNNILAANPAWTEVNVLILEIEQIG